ETLMAGVRGKEIAMIFQNPRSALNPYSTIGKQLVETIRLHTNFKGERQARERAIHWLERVRIDSPRLRFDNFPFGMSGGMCQRAETIRRKSYLQAIEGEVLDTIEVPRGCRFYGRCNRVTEAIRGNCAGLEPPLGEVAPGHKVRCWLYPAAGKP